jgi:hypothetical protein
MTRANVLDALLVLGGMGGISLGVLAARAIAQGQGPTRANAAAVKLEPVEPVSPRFVRAAVPGGDLLRAEVEKRSAAGEFSTVFYAPKAPAPAATPADPKARPNEPKLVLSSIMAGREPFAIIDGNLLRVGARVGDRWTVKTINPEAGTVTLESLDGESQELKLRP